MLDSVEREVAFRDVPELTTGDVPGHRHVFVHGACGGLPVIIQSGRLHFYEGLDYAGVTATCEYLHRHGVRKVIFINSAGGLNPSFSTGDLVAIDRVRLWRYRHWDATPGAAFTDFQVPGCDWTGTFQWVHGPSYETRAEIAALQNMKAAAVGMSTAPELVRCQELGIECAVVSCITNCCYKAQVLTHAEVIAAAQRASAKLAALLRPAIPAMAAAR